MEQDREQIQQLFVNSYCEKNHRYENFKVNRMDL